MDKPYSRFFWRDHEQDLNLSACHPFAQGIWMRMQAIMAQGEPYGHLRMEPRKAAPSPPPAANGGGGAKGSARPHGGAGGVPGGIAPALPGGGAGGGAHGGLETRYTLPKSGSLEHLIFSRCGVTQEQMEWVIEHLEEHGVFSRDEAGIIYSRRMVRELKDHTQRVERATRAREAYERRRAKNPPDPGGGKHPQKRGNGVDLAAQSGGVGGRPPGTPRGGPPAIAGGVPGGPPIPITRTTNTEPPDPPFAKPRRKGAQAQTRHERELESAKALVRGRA